MNIEQKIWKRLSGKSRDLVLTRRSGTLRRAVVVVPAPRPQPRLYAPLNIKLTNDIKSLILDPN